ncbi:DUF4145 domain-containing protein [Laribacter hongkongensis]|uniref:DUF4145 domain-containing protein n=1 Tax=Laribacter hongkongensis TaxID=168471 RepID=UPI001EFC39EB|nr:DUF4145 domain-containing protein [Laribacter hongkongensis]MCG9081078.1 DUF4145 domain-containing protein [Laribacter hongkongensis]
MSIENNVHSESNIDEKIDSFCLKCERNTNHNILCKTEQKRFKFYENNDLEYGEINKFFIVECCGCNNIHFMSINENSEDTVYCGGDEPQYHQEINIYPDPQAGRQPIKHMIYLPEELDQIYLETLQAINRNQPILAGIGIRAIIEIVCKSQGADEKSLNEKIESLVTNNMLSRKEADTLHQLRTLGNSAAHEAIPHKINQLQIAFDVVDHLLQGVYVIPRQAEKRLPISKASNNVSKQK